MGVVVLEGIVVTLLVVVGLREAIMNAVPLALKRAIGVGKQVMHETSLGEGRLSVASVAVDYARERRVQLRFVDFPPTVINAFLAAFTGVFFTAFFAFFAMVG